MRQPSYSQLLEVCRGLGYRTFRQPYDLNLFGVRAAGGQVDRYDDLVGAWYVDHDGNQRVFAGAATTKPGLTYLRNPTRRDGTAIMLPGQYPGLYRLGLHHRSEPAKAYEALEQVSDARFVRDADRDADLDLGGQPFTGNIKANIHRAGSGASDRVGAASAACQVFRWPGDFEVLLGLARAQRAAGHGDRFTYTLLTEEQLRVHDASRKAL